MTDTNKLILSTREVAEAARLIAMQIPTTPLHIYGVPRGGASAALAIRGEMLRLFPDRSIELIAGGDLDGVYATQDNTLVVDDIYDSGATLKRFIERGYSCAVLCAKARDLPGRVYVGIRALSTEWVVFPWEGESSGGPEDAVRRLLQYIGEDPDAPHLQETPRRFLSWLNEFRADQEPDFHATKFEVRYDGMVVVRGIPFTSLCAHHLLPFSGRAALAYIPVLQPTMTPPELHNVLGLSKLARIVQHHAHRLQSQEEMTTQIRDAIQEASGSWSVGVVVSAEHSCMNFRGPRVPGAETITSALSGAFYEQDKTREEFMALARGVL